MITLVHLFARAGRLAVWAGIGCVIAVAAATAAPVAERPRVQPRIVDQLSFAQDEMVLAAAHAGKRIVTVGAHGIILLSDDEGATFRQARQVPIQATLTSVCFIDDKRGWAAGHWGAILATTDGGETWQLQRSDTAVDRPLFSVLFKNDKDGWAAGLWSLILTTKDGGATWQEAELPASPGGKGGDLNLYAIFTNPEGMLFITAEQGKLLRSDDDGRTWAYVATGYNGTFWTGITLRNGTMLVGGLRGTVYRSVDHGRSWVPARTDTPSSITSFVEATDGIVAAVALDGVSFVSQDGGESFAAEQRPDRVAMTSVLSVGADKPLAFSKVGPLTKANEEQGAAAPGCAGAVGCPPRPKSGRGDIPLYLLGP